MSKLILEAVPSDPNREEYRQGNTMGADFRHWRRAKIGHRFRLFFRFDSKSRVIIFAWVNDETTCVPRAASTIRTQSFNACCREETHQMTGRNSCWPVNRNGLDAD